MPSFFQKGQPAALRNILDGDAARQKEAIWGYLAQGTNAPSPQPRPPIPVTVPRADSGPLVAQIPIQVPGAGLVESICVLTAQNDLALYDLGTAALRNLFTGAAIFRNPNGGRSFMLQGTPLLTGTSAPPPILLITQAGREPATNVIFHGYDRLA